MSQSTSLPTTAAGIDIPSLVATFVTIGIAIVLWYVTRKVMKTERAVTDVGKKAMTTGRRLVCALVIIIAFFVVLEINGVEVNSLVTSLGAASVVSGIIIKDPLSDFFMAFTISSHQLLSVGDAVNFQGEDAIVEELGSRMVRIKLLSNGATMFIFNRDITNITKITDMTDIDVALPYSLDFRKADEVMEKIIARMSRLGGVHEAVYKGTQKFADSAIYYKLRMFCDLSRKYDLIRESNHIIQEELDAAGISMPYPQLDVHMIADALTEAKAAEN